jgi:hypothetical protein
VVAILPRQWGTLGFAPQEHRDNAERREAGHRRRHPVEAAAEGPDQRPTTSGPKLVMTRALPVQNPMAVERI